MRKKRGVKRKRCDTVLGEKHLSRDCGLPAKARQPITNSLADAVMGTDETLGRLSYFPLPLSP